MAKQYKVGDVVESMSDVGGFHSHSHLFFKRVGNGDMRIQKWSEKAPWTLESEVILDPHSWASVVSSVSFLGEDYARFRHIIDFHEERP